MSVEAKAAEFINSLKPLLCDECGVKIGFLAECDNQSCFFCDDCVARARLARLVASEEPSPLKPDEAFAVLNDMIDRWNETPIFLPDPESEGPKP